MRPDVVVVATPRFDADLGFEAIPKPRQRGVLIEELAVEGFVCSVLSRLGGIDERRCDCRALRPPQDGLRHGLGAVSDRR
jgi:hypothetical protein